MWLSPEGHTLIVEVKTTDAYRLSLDTLATYRQKLADAGQLTANSSILIVVGRHDTGELEAQIRGSRHAWDIRLISAESLIKLVLLKENTEAEESGLKMRSLLTPIEYTRLDRMVDVMFTTVTDLQEEPDQDELIDDEEGSARLDELTGVAAETTGTSESKGIWQFTDSQVLQAKREKIIIAVGQREGANLVKKSRALYWNAKRDVRVACSMSKVYATKTPYWYAFHPRWDEFLGEVERGFFVLGCMDRDTAFAIPHKILKPLLSQLHTTSTKPGGLYWHIHLVDSQAGLALHVPQGERLLLDPFKVTCSAL